MIVDFILCYGTYLIPPETRKYPGTPKGKENDPFSSSIPIYIIATIFPLK